MSSIGAMSSVWYWYPILSLSLSLCVRKDYFILPSHPNTDTCCMQMLVNKISFLFFFLVHLLQEHFAVKEFNIQEMKVSAQVTTRIMWVSLTTGLEDQIWCELWGTIKNFVQPLPPPQFTLIPIFSVNKLLFHYFILSAVVSDLCHSISYYMFTHDSAEWSGFREFRRLGLWTGHWIAGAGTTTILLMELPQGHIIILAKVGIALCGHTSRGYDLWESPDRNKCILLFLRMGGHWI